MFQIFIILCFPLLQAQHLFPTELHYLMYGNLWNMKNTFLPITGAGYKDGVTIPKPNITMAEALSNSYNIYSINEILDGFNTTKSKGHDEHEYNQLNFKVLNLTRNTRKHYWIQYLFNWFTYDKTEMDQESDLTIDFEGRKRERLEAIALTYLIHARYLLDGAMKQRVIIRDEKRYKIGYLFNRLRRIKTEMLKIVRMNHESHIRWETANVMLSIRLYEEVLRMEMDARDTMLEIKDLYEKYEEYDFIKVDPVNSSTSKPEKGEKPETGPPPPPHGPNGPLM